MREYIESAGHATYLDGREYSFSKNFGDTGCAP
jgi:hypothetical protein